VRSWSETRRLAIEASSDFSSAGAEAGADADRIKGSDPKFCNRIAP
jgi:hypothetical protein